MNTQKFSGDMADQIEKDRDELIELRAKCERLEGELHQFQEDRQSNGVIADNMIELNERLEFQCSQMREALELVFSSLKGRHNLVHVRNTGCVACDAMHAALESLSTTAGTAILARLEEARRLLESVDAHATFDSGNATQQWRQRRDKWLKG